MHRLLRTPVNKKPADVTDAYAFLSGSGAADAGLDVIDDSGASIASLTADAVEDAKAAGWIVQIELGSSVRVGRTITLHYNNVTVQRHLTVDDPARIEVYSGKEIDPVLNDGPPINLPQYPANEPKDITVDYAANGSGTVTFALIDLIDVVTYTGDPISNSSASIPAGIEKDDERELIIMFAPDGNMGHW